jgi:hypothetical protein
MINAQVLTNRTERLRDLDAFVTESPSDMPMASVHRISRARCRRESMPRFDLEQIED